MRIWRLATFAQRCGRCNSPIAKGDTFLELQLQTTKALRCKACGERMCGEAAPTVIQEDAHNHSAATALAGITYQPSFGLASTGRAR